MTARRLVTRVVTSSEHSFLVKTPPNTPDLNCFSRSMDSNNCSLVWVVIRSYNAGFCRSSLTHSIHAIGSHGICFWTSVLERV
jgi:hypothetical protein